MSPSLKKTILAASAYFLIFIAIIIFVLSPAITGLKQKKIKLSEKQSELNGIYTKINSFQRIQKNPGDFKAKTDTVQNLLPDNLDVSQFLVQTDTLAKNNSLILENVTIAELKNPKPAPKEDADSTKSKDKSGEETAAPAAAAKKAETGTQFTFGFIAPYNSVLSLIKGLETLPRFNTVTSVTLNGTADNLIDAKVTGNIYYGK